MDTRKIFSFNLLVLVFFMVLFGIFSVYLGQDYNFDFRAYHLYNPYAFMNGRLGFDYAPAHTPTFYNPLPDLPFYFFYTFLTPKWVGFCIGAIHGINGWLVYLITLNILSLKGSRLYVESMTKRRIFSLATGITGIYSAMNIAELGATFNDNLLSLFVLSSLLFIVKRHFSTEERTDRSVFVNIFIAGAIMGGAGGAKLVGLLYVLGSIFAAPLLMVRFKERLRALFLWGTGLFAGFLVTHGYWSLILWQKFKSPLFPYFNYVFKSPYYPLTQSVDLRFLPKTITEKLFFPFYFTDYEAVKASETYFRDIRLAVVYTLIVLVLIKVVYRTIARKGARPEGQPPDIADRLTLFITMFFTASYLFWQYKFAVYRYLLSLELLSPVIIILLLSYLLAGINRKSVAIAAGVLFLAIFVMVKPASWGRVAWTDSFFGFNMPNIELHDDSVILVAGRDATAFMALSFPKHVRFVSIASDGFTAPEQNNLYQAEVQEIIDDLKAPTYVILDYRSFKLGQNTLKHYGLKLIESTRRRIQIKKYRYAKPLYICEVTKIAK